jgi:hypothetical protein
MLSSFVGLLSQSNPIDPKFQALVSAGLPEDLIKQIIIQGGDSCEEIRIIQLLHYKDADGLVVILQNSLHESAISPKTKIFSYPIQNKLILMGNKKNGG